MMIESRLRIGLALFLVMCVMAMVNVALADREDALEMQTYWQLVGDHTRTDVLTRAMNGDAALTLTELKSVTAEELLAFAADNKLPVSMARHSWYTALADRLAAEIPQGTTGERLALFLDMRQNARDKMANAQRRDIRKSLTEADISAYAAETGLPAGFLAWLMLDDEWYEPEWDDGDDWREGRRTWDFADWVDADDLREKYGRDAVVTDDDVERVLRQNGYRFDD